MPQKRTLILATLGLASALNAGTIVQGGSGLILFEAENADVSVIDNSGGTSPTLGWTTWTTSDHSVISNASGSEALYAQEAGASLFDNSVTYSLNFDASASGQTFNIFGRFAYGDSDEAGSDSLFTESGQLGGSVTSVSKALSSNLSDSSFLWGYIGAVTVASSGGDFTYTLGSREDGMIIDRIAFKSSTDSTDTALFDSIANSAVIVPEPSNFALLFGGLALAISATKRRSRKA